MLEVITYYSVGAREASCIALTMTALHNIEVKAADVLNAYVIGPNGKKIKTVLDPEFGDGVGKFAIIVKALYGLRVQVHPFKHILHNACSH